MSTAWFKPKFVPQLLKSFPNSSTKKSTKSSRIEVWNTTCIVTNFGKTKAPKCSILINPSSPSLLGVRKFPYFPSGGPQPSVPPSKYEHHIMGYVSKWGGMDMKEGRMLFPLNVVDGLVHELGGFTLAVHCLLLPKKKNCSQEQGGDVRCPVGCAVSTPLGGKRLGEEYDRIVHTVPPFYEHYDGGDPNEALANCYRNSLALCESIFSGNHDSSLRVASPLLGAGARGFPLQEAMAIAAKESLRWRNAEHDTDGNAKERVLSFGIPQMDVASRFIDTMMELDGKRL